MSDETTDFRGKLLVDKSYSYKSQFVEQMPIEDLLPYLDNAFDKGVLAIKWHQYVPGFNDGDPCEFTLYEVLYTSNKKVAQAWVEDHSADYYFNDENTEYPDLDYVDDYQFTLGDGHPDGLSHDVDVPVDEARFEMAVRAEFGDDVTVVITPDSTYKFDYECGY